MCYALTNTLSFLMLNSKLFWQKTFGEQGWAEFGRMCEYKAETCGKHVIQIGRFEPSSKMCSVCGPATPKQIELLTDQIKAGTLESDTASRFIDRLLDNRETGERGVVTMRKDLEKKAQSTPRCSSTVRCWRPK